MIYLLQIPFTVSEIVLVSLLYLLLDIYPRAKSFRAMLTTGSFLVLWGAFSALTGIAYFFLTTTSLARVQSLVGPTGAKLTIVILAALMGATVLQSLSLKISDVKVVNLEALLDGYRRQVLADIAKKNSENEQLAAYRLSDKLVKKFKNRVEELSVEYCQLFTESTESGMPLASVLESEATAKGIPTVNYIAAKIVRMNHIRARLLLQKEL